MNIIFLNDGTTIAFLKFLLLDVGITIPFIAALCGVIHVIVRLMVRIDQIPNEWHAHYSVRRRKRLLESVTIIGGFLVFLLIIFLFLYVFDTFGDEWKAWIGDLSFLPEC